MSLVWSRRRVLQRMGAAVGWAVTGGGAAAAAGGDEEEAGRPSGAMSAYAYERNIWVRVDGRNVTCYRAGAHQKLPYFYPLLGPATGLPMTEEAGDPYPHHRSLYLGCDHVNRANFWQEGLARGQIASRGPTVADGGPDRVIVQDTCDWHVPGQPAVIEDQRSFTLTAPTQNLRLIDADIKLTARADVHVTRTNHSLFAVRAAHALSPAGGGTLFNANGQEGQKATLGQKAPWCGYRGERLGRTETIVLMDHPANPWSPCPWVTRDYGFISPTAFNWLDEKGWTLPQGHDVRLRYRVLVAAGSPDRDELNRWYDPWTTAGG